MLTQVEVEQELDRFARDGVAIRQRIRNTTGATREDAEDVYQDALLNALVGIQKGQFDRSKRFEPWFKTVASNAGISAYRARKRHIHHELPSINEISITNDFTDSSKLQEKVRHILDICPPKYQEIISIMYLYGRTHSMVAKAMDIPVGTAKSKMHRAKKEFIRLWESEYGEYSIGDLSWLD